MDTESFDFFEMSEKKDEGWNIYGVRLDGKKPEIGIPEKLLNQQLDYSQPLPDPDLKNGKTVIYGRILGYDPTHGIALKFNVTANSPEAGVFVHSSFEKPLPPR
mgnify:CR=1 FL=1